MIFPSPAGMSLSKHSLDMDNVVSDIPAEDGKIDNLFYSVSKRNFIQAVSMVHTTIIQAKILEDIIQALGFMSERRWLTIEKRDVVSMDEEILQQGVTKRYRLSWLTNSALVYEPKCGGMRWVTGSQPMSSCAHEAQINF
jgi:hypothetical protein